MELHSVLVTGANRGIGLEFVRQFSRLPKPPRFVFATYRSLDSLEPLTDIKHASKDCQVILIRMDVTVQEDVIAAKNIIEQAVGEIGLTLLINNAGAHIAEYFSEINEINLLKTFNTNTVGPIRVLQEMWPLLQKSASRGNAADGMRTSRAAAINISSIAGSFYNPFPLEFVTPEYRISKAALNMAMKAIAASVKDQGILVVLVSPGWVKTDMGTYEATITAEECVSSILRTLENLDDSHHGAYIGRLGDPKPF